MDALAPSHIQPLPPTKRANSRAYIWLSFGANKAGPWGRPEQTLRRALECLKTGQTRLIAASHFMITQPHGPKAQAAFINGACIITSALPPQSLLMKLKQIERSAGRRGGRPWGARSCDMDIIDYKGIVWGNNRPVKNRRLEGGAKTRKNNAGVRPNVFYKQAPRQSICAKPAQGAKARFSASAQPAPSAHHLKGHMGHLTVPHMDMHNRSFVLEPMLALQNAHFSTTHSQWRHPRLKQTLKALTQVLHRRRGT